MQLFIGGTCAGKHDAVSERFPTAQWHRLNPGAALDSWRERVTPGRPLVVTGWLDWLASALVEEPDDDSLRHAGRQALEAMVDAERRLGGEEVVLILDEVGRGIVPVEPRDRRLRDLTGWLAQDVAERSEVVWYVRHGLVQRLCQVKPRAQGDRR